MRTLFRSLRVAGATVSALHTGASPPVTDSNLSSIASPCKAGTGFSQHLMKCWR